jgi:hypothetical protein
MLFSSELGVRRGRFFFFWEVNLVVVVRDDMTNHIQRKNVP